MTHTSVHSSAPEGADALRGKKFSPWRFIIVVAVMAAVVVLLHYSKLSVYLEDIQKLKEYADAHGPLGWLVFAASMTALIMAGFPRLVACGIAGFLFGFNIGIVLTQASTLVAAYATFMFFRWTGLHWATDRLAKYQVVKALLHVHSPLSVFLVRQLPIHGTVTNALLAATHVRHRDFLVGSFFGFLPYAIVATLVGSGVGKASPAVAWIQVGVACVIALAIGVSVWNLRKRLHLSP